MFHWSALITVTLVAVSAGYAVVGHAVNRTTAMTRLYVVLVAASL